MRGKSLAAIEARPRLRAVDASSILEALAFPVLVVDRADEIVELNGAAEEFLGRGGDRLRGRPLRDVLAADSPLFSLIDQVRQGRAPVTNFGLTVEAPRMAPRRVDVRASLLADDADSVVVCVPERSIAERLDRRLFPRGAARSIGSLAALLAHEVKNPLSGIRGAAQLLEETVPPEERALTRLIRDEVDRICRLVDGMEAFQDAGSTRRDRINVHRVLDRVVRLAESGFGRHVRFRQAFDPSLPPLLGDGDQLVQVFLNLVKNAVEAVPREGGEVTLATAFGHGVRVAEGSSGGSRHLPLIVRVEDNGAGIPESVGSDLFEPFVTTKIAGHGLGLALVAKIVDDHGGAIEWESVPGRTVFRVLLPLGEAVPVEAGGPPL